MSDHADRLIAREMLPPEYATVVDRYWRPLAEWIARRSAATGTPMLIGINGPQGSGKSTLCLFLEHLLAQDHGRRVAVLSLDDLYLTHAERKRLAAEVHPLFATRGVPGTHDIGLGEQVIAALTEHAGDVALPRFDKAADDRAPRDTWPIVRAPVDIILLEGWCVGARPQTTAELRQPANRLERDEDGAALWRMAVNDQLAGPYQSLFGRLHHIVMLRPSGFERVREWRMLQERKLSRRHGGGMSADRLDRFIMHYERLTRHMLAEMPGRADVLVEIGDDHNPDRIAFR